MLADSAALLVCGLLMKRPGKSIFWLAAGVLGVNILLTIADQFGLIDLLFLLLNIITLVMLIKSRRGFVA